MLVAQEQDKRLALEREARAAGWLKQSFHSAQELKTIAASRFRGATADIQEEQADRMLLQRRARVAAGDFFFR